MRQEALQNAARRCFAVNTTEMCRGCLRDLKERTGIACGVGRVAASLAGVAGGRRWRASLAGVAGEAPQKDRQFQLRELKRPTPLSTENNTQRTANGGGSRARARENRQAPADSTTTPPSHTQQRRFHDTRRGDRTPAKATSPG